MAQITTIEGMGAGFTEFTVTVTANADKSDPVQLGPNKDYSISASVASGSVTDWTADLEISLDGKVWTMVVQSKTATPTASIVGKPARFARVNLTGFTGTGTLAVKVVAVS